MIESSNFEVPYDETFKLLGDRLMSKDAFVACEFELPVESSKGESLTYRRMLVLDKPETESGLSLILRRSASQSAGLTTDRDFLMVDYFDYANRIVTSINMTHNMETWGASINHVTFEQVKDLADWGTDAVSTFLVMRAMRRSSQYQKPTDRNYLVDVKKVMLMVSDILRTGKVDIEAHEANEAKEEVRRELNQSRNPILENHLIQQYDSSSRGVINQAFAHLKDKYGFEG